MTKLCGFLAILVTFDRGLRSASLPLFGLDQSATDDEALDLAGALVQTQ
jgi:hypothetical protein